MADLKKSFDEVKEAASGFTGGNIMTSLQKDVTNALRIDDVDKPMDAQMASAVGEPVPASDATTTNTDPVTPTTPAAPAPETFVEAEAHSAAAEPLAITPQIQPEPAAPMISDVARDAKAS